MAESPIRVEGLRELRKAFAVASDELDSGVKEALAAAGDPVKFSAEQLSLSRIRGLRRGTIPWHSMRVGVTRTSVYVAPVQRGVKAKANASLRRRRFKSLMQEQALDPALAQNHDRVEQEFEDALRDMARAWERVGGARARG